MVLMALTSCKQTQQQDVVETETLDIPECIVSTPPDSLHLNPFYKKYVDVNGRRVFYTCYCQNVKIMLPLQPKCINN